MNGTHIYSICLDRSFTYQQCPTTIMQMRPVACFQCNCYIFSKNDLDVVLMRDLLNLKHLHQPA